MVFLSKYKLFHRIFFKQPIIVLVFTLFFPTLLYSASDNAFLGLPVENTANFNVQVLDRPSFCLGYSEEHEQAAWVCYKLTKSEVINKVVKRTDNFRPDPEIITKSTELIDYKGSGYDRGHLAPAGDMGWSYNSMSQSFFLSNISPQQPGFNRGIWKNLEETVRSWAVQNEEIFIVTGPLLTEGLNSIGPNHVSVPDFYYKVILDYYGPEKKGIAFLLPNKASNEHLTKYVKSINDIELVTGLDFFHELPDLEEDQLESSVDCGLWFSVISDSNSLLNKNNDQLPVTIFQESKDKKQDPNDAYWITTASGIRHNSSCQWYKKSKGHPSSKTEGRACKLCGG